MSLFSRLNLTAVVAVLALFDLVVDRLVLRLFMPATNPGGSGLGWLAFVAAFISYLGGALALLLFASSFLGLIRRRELFPRSLRMVASILAVFFVVLFTFCTSSYPSSPRLFIQLRTSQAFLAWIIGLAIWRASVPVRAKIGTTLFLLPPILHTAALFLGETSATRGGPLPGQLIRLGEVAAFLAAGCAPLLLPRTLREGRPTLVAFLLGAAAVAALAVTAALKFDLVQVLALYGLRLELPPLSVPGARGYLLLFALAVFGVVTAVIPALRAGGGSRLYAYGIIMVVSAGYQVGSPPDLAIATAGLLAMAVGITRRGNADAAPPVRPVSAEVPAAA